MVVARHIKDPLAIHSKAEMTNAVMSLLDQVAKLSERNSQLREQSSQLTEQNFKLGAENSQVTEQNSQLSEQLSLVTEQNARLQEENTALVQRVSDLERSVGLNSGNSSKPPSSDGLKKPSAKENRRTRSQRDTSNRKSGGQPGHKGTTLKQVKNPDKITDHFPPRCQACEAALSPEESIRSAARQVFDLPPPPPLIVTEHRAHTCECHHCGAQTRAAFPEDITSPAQYGDGIAALAAYLQTLHCIPEKRLAQLILDTYGIKISAATLARQIAKKAKEMNPFAEAVKDQLSGEQTAVKHLDETGLRVAGKTRWIHVLCSIALSYFRLGDSRGDVPVYLLGTAVHDCFTSNWTLKGVKHGVCNSHTLRELKALIEFEKEPWTSDMTTILLDAKKIRDIARSQGQDAVEPEAIKEIERQGNRLNKPLTRLYFLNRGVRAHLFFRRFRLSCTPNDSTAPAFLTHFQAVEDPRQEGEVLYPLEEIFLLVLCGVISGADGWTSIALYGQKKLELLRRFLPYENGTPSHDQLGILFSRLDMEVFQSCFISWVASLNETLEGVVAADGKTLRRSFDTSSSRAAIHMVSAWACDQKLVLGQRKVDDKSNEITAIPELLELLKIKGAIVAIDAMGCQRKICKNPVKKKANYVIGLKGKAIE